MTGRDVAPRERLSFAKPEWLVAGSKGTRLLVTDADGNLIAEVIGYLDGLQPGTAQLMAAAPDLLAACTRALAASSERERDQADTDLRLAIEKATRASRR